jgi:hypothetical protein
MTDPSPINDFARRLRQEIVRSLDALPDTRSRAAEALFNERALELFRLQCDAVPILRQVAAKRGLRPEHLVDWRQIPDIPSTAFKEFDVSSVPEGMRVATFLSSGTTGEHRSRHAHSASSLGLYETSLAAWFDQCVMDGAAGRGCWRIVSLTPPADTAPQSSLAHMASVVIRECGADGSCCVGQAHEGGAWRADLESVRAAIGGAGTVPVVLFGTAFSFVHLLDDLKTLGRTLVLPPGSRVMETGGYKGRSREMPKAELHRALAAALGIPEGAIVTEYGMSELSSQAYDRAPGSGSVGLRRRHFHLPPWARGIVVSPEDGCEVRVGETGMLRVVDLANVGSVLALGTGDLAVRQEDGFVLLGRPSQSEPRGCSLLPG